MVNKRILVFLALFSTYFFWGSTYLAMRFGLESFPPFLLAGLRFIVAGVMMYVVLRFMGYANPSLIQWRGAAVLGALLPVLGNGTVCYVQQTVSSSVAALSIATVPIWMAIFSTLWGHKINRQEWFGILIGFVGIVLLNMGGTLQGQLTSALLLLFAAGCWSFGSVWSKHLALPQGMMGAACQMLIGGVILMLVSAYAGEVWPARISSKSWASMIFLTVFSSIVAYSAYQYLLKTVRPLVATSNTFVNPIVAFAVGIWLANEEVTQIEYIALTVIIVGVFLVLTAENKEA